MIGEKARGEKFVRKKVSDERRGILAILTVSIVFGLSFMFTKRAVNDVSVYTLLSWRFFAAFFVLLSLTVVGVLKVNFAGKKIGALFLLSAIYPVTYFISEAAAISRVASSEAGLFIATIPIATMILAAIFLKEKTTTLQKVSIVFSVLGVALISLTQNDHDAQAKSIGYLLLGLAVLSGALFMVLTKRITHFSSVEKTLVMMGTGAFFFSCLAAVEHHRAGTVATWLSLPLTNRSFLISLIYLSLITSALAFFLQNYAISKIGATRAASFAPLTTLISIVAGVAFLGEPLSIPMLVGASMILAGVIGANWQTPKRRLRRKEQQAE